ncbi:sugar phosphate isomerase/epimerase family protein [Paenarthrobacter sp. NPDC057981]|uniref:sugar phosphate isomerase/epimerase family protein n=1 Tax=Paenarthrobacter sp. NPDC057981 TaxID=3346297 RepID=UPI0036DB5C37
MTTAAMQSPPNERLSRASIAATNFGFLWTEGLGEGLGRIAQAGITRTELMVSLPHVDLRQSRSKLAHDINDATRRNGLALTSLNPVDMNLVSANGAIAEESLEQLLLTIDLAEDVGAPIVVVVPGKYSALVPMNEQHALETFRRSVEIMLPRAAERGIKLAFENVPFGFLESPNGLWTELKSYETDLIGLTVDAANLHFAGQDFRTEIEAVQKHILIVHISDTDRSRFKHGHIGEGDVDFAEVASALKAVEYLGDIVYELATPGVDWARWQQDLLRLRQLGWA